MAENLGDARSRKKLAYMRPATPIYDGINTTIRQMKASCNRSLRFATFCGVSNLTYKIVRQFRIAVSLPTRTILGIAPVGSSLLCRISIVISSSSEKQMARVAARRIIARVQDAHSFWNWPPLEFVHQSMRSFYSFLSRTECKHPVSEGCPRLCHPWPAGGTSSRLIDLLPQSFLKSFSSRKPSNRIAILTPPCVVSTTPTTLSRALRTFAHRTFHTNTTLPYFEGVV